MYINEILEGFLASEPLPWSVMMPHTALMLHTVPLHAGSFPWMGSTTTPSPANTTLALWASREVSLHRSNVLRVDEERNEKNEEKKKRLLLSKENLGLSGK